MKNRIRELELSPYDRVTSNMARKDRFELVDDLVDAERSHAWRCGYLVGFVLGVVLTAAVVFAARMVG